jgi:hypothetical protein
VKWTMIFLGTGVPLLVGTAAGQVDLLTPREAVQVVGEIGEVAQARKQGYCPQFSASYGDTLDKLGVQVRYGCGSFAGQLINNYRIDLRNGLVSEMETGAPIHNSDADTLSRTLLTKARARRLSVQEGRCLVLEAAKDLAGWSGPEHEVSVEPSGPFGLRYRARLVAQNPSVVAERFFTIDRAAARVHDDETGMDVVSPNVAVLASMMLTLHQPSLLSGWDALEIAQQIPEVKSQAARPCSVFHIGGPLSWEAIYIAVQSHCEGQATQSSILVAVDPETGTVTDPNSMLKFVSSAADHLAQERLNALNREKEIAREKVNASCGVR